MKITRAWLFTAILAVAAFGCGDDDDDDVTPDAAGNIDAAAPPPDADTTPDAVPPDAAVTPDTVTLTVLDGGAPFVGIDVVFSNRDGTLISHQTTDSAGQATETLPFRGMITIFEPLATGAPPTEYNAYTLATVMPGDNITIETTLLGAFADGGGPGSIAGTVTVDWPGEQTGATEYRATDGCEEAVETAPGGGGGDPPDTTAELNTNCRIPESTNHHILAQAVMIDGDAENLLGASYAKTVAPDDTVTLPAWSTNYEGPSVSLSNPPKGVLAVFGDGTFTLDGITFDMLDGDFFFGGGGTYDVLVPQGIGAESVQSQTFLLYAVGMSLQGFSGILANQTGVGSDVSQDLAADALPGAINGVLDTSTPERPALAWSVTGDLSVADLGQISLGWEDTTANELHNWLVAFNPGTNDPFQLPELPAALEAFEPDSTTTYDGLQVIYIDASYVTDDWDTIRANGGTGDFAPPGLDFVLRFSLPAIDQGSPVTAESAPMLHKLLKQRARDVVGRILR